MTLHKKLLFFLFFIFGLSVAVKLNSGKDLNCPRYWIDASHVDLGCLLFNATSPLLWIEAENFCGGSGNSAHLVEIFNEYQQDFLVAEALQSELLTGQSRPWWIGLTGIYTNINPE